MRMTILILVVLAVWFQDLAAQRIEKVNWIESAEPQDVSILLMGDINIQNRPDPASGFSKISATLAEADIRFCNLEGAFAGTGTDPNVNDIPHKPSWTHSDPKMVEGLKSVDMDVVGVANNVTYPNSALMKSLMVLDAAGIRSTGGGANIKEATQPVILERNGTKIGFIQYACTVFPFDHAATNTQPGIAQVKVSTSYEAPRNLDKPGQPPYVRTQVNEQSLTAMTNHIRSLKQNADVVIASYHWGVSNVYEPDPYQRQIAQAAIDAGADVIFGHGAHKLQEVEVYQEKPIFYCVGQGVFDWWKVRSSLNGLLVRVLVRDKQLYQVAAVPMQRDEDNAPILYHPDQGIGKEIFERLAQNRKPTRARLLVKGQEIEICHRDRKEEVPKLAQAWATPGFLKPESAVYDRDRQMIYVGNINGDSPGDGRDGDGFISKVSMQGEILELKWVEGLNDPKGMDIRGDVLWVNDISEVVEIDVVAGKIVRRYPVPNVVFLNDISISPGGEIFTNDADGHQTFRFRDGRFQLFWKDIERGRPNGIWAEEDRLLIATSNSHKLISVDRSSRRPHLLAEGIGRGDGIEAVGNGDYFVSDYSGRIFYFSSMEYLYPLIDKVGEHHTADFEYIPNEQLLVVPTHKNNSLIGFKVEWEDSYAAPGQQH